MKQLLTILLFPTILFSQPVKLKPETGPVTLTLGVLTHTIMVVPHINQPLNTKQKLGLLFSGGVGLVLEIKSFEKKKSKPKF